MWKLEHIRPDPCFPSQVLRGWDGKRSIRRNRKILAGPVEDRDLISIGQRASRRYPIRVCSLIAVSGEIRFAASRRTDVPERNWMVAENGLVICGGAGDGNIFILCMGLLGIERYSA